MNPFKQGQRVRFKKAADVDKAKRGVVIHVSHSSVDVAWDATEFAPSVTSAYHYTTLVEVKEDDASQ